MDDLTILSKLASLAAIIGLLYLILIGQKSLPEWWREIHPLAVRASSQSGLSPQALLLRQTPPGPQRKVRYGIGAFTSLRKLEKARQLYQQARVDVHPEFDGLIRIARRVTWLDVLGLMFIVSAIILCVTLTNRFDVFWNSPGGNSPPTLTNTPTPTPTSTPIPITYQILIISSSIEVQTFNCGETVRLHSSEQIQLAISPLQDGKLEWKSAAQGPLGVNSPVAYTPGEFIGNIDIVSYYRNDAKLCWLQLLKAP